MQNEKIKNYVTAILKIAADDKHGYSQLDRWGVDYDCSSLIISQVEAAGIPVKNKGALSTHTMLKAFLHCGFKDVTKTVNLKTGEGMQTGDILLNPGKHTEVFISPGRRVGAHSDERGGVKGAIKGDQTGDEISVKPYANLSWRYVLRYM